MSKKNILLGLMGFAVLNAQTLYYNNYKEFSLLKQFNNYGNIQTVGNTVECVTNRDFAFDWDWEDNYSDFDCQNSLLYNDNNYIVKYIDIDNNVSTFNSSTATLKLPDTFKKIKWVGLFWQGHINNYSYIFTSWFNNYYSNDYPGDITKTTANQVFLKIGNTDYLPVSANEVDYVGSNNGVIYSAYADVTDYFKNKVFSPNEEINVTVANVLTSKGLESGIGDYGAWNLVVVYDEDVNNPNSKLRSNNIFYGFEEVNSYNPYKTIEINHLVLPHYGNVDSKMSVFSGEGDFVYYNDTLSLNGVNLYETYTDEEILRDYRYYFGRNISVYNNMHNIFDSILSNDIKRYPKLINNNGIDIDVFDTSNIMTATRNSNPDAKEYSATISLTSSGDAYFPSVITFSTELYQPRVCYYIDTIKDDSGNIIYKNGHFIDKIEAGKTYNILFWIANMKKDVYDRSIDTAKNVKLITTYNDFDYAKESTYVKNIRDINFNHITDEKDNDIGEFIEDENKSILRIGIGANATHGGEIPPTFVFSDPTKKVFVEINGSFNSTRNEEVELTHFLNFYSTFETDYVDINNTVPIPKCIDFNLHTLIYKPPIGTFNVVSENFSGNVDPVNPNHPLNALYTQKINEPFDVKILHLDKDKQTLTRYTGIIRVDLIKIPQDKNLSNLNLSQLDILDSKYFILPNVKEVDTKNTIPKSSFVSSKISKDTAFIVRYLADNNKFPLNWSCISTAKSCIWKMIKTTYNCSNNINNCPCANECKPTSIATPQRCLECLFDSSKISYVLSRDDFAIRPKKFEITDIPNKIKAGEEFNLTLKAVDKNGNVVKDYNETIGDSVALEAVSANSKCKNGVLKIIEGGEFKDGVAKVKAIYTEVGEVNLTLKENKGKEFAKVDEDDTPDKDRFIEKNTTQLYSVPEHFKVSGTLNNYKNGKFTYLSNDLNMSAVLDLNIVAKAKDDKTTENYNRACYAKDINITISKDLIPTPKNLTQILYIYKDTNDKNSSKLNVLVDKNITIENYSRNNFTTDNNGSTTLTIYINFDKNYSNPQVPFKMIIKDVNIRNEDTNKTVIEGGKIKDSITYYYGRMEAKEASGYGREVNSTFKYDYWTNDEEWQINDKHSKEYGEVNLTKSYVNTTPLKESKLKDSEAEDVKDGIQNVKFKVNHSLPYGAKVHLAIPSWLWYHPLAKEYKAPSKDNINCLTHPCIKVNFLDNSKGWGGVSANSKVIRKEYNESKRTIEINFSTKKTISKDVKKLNW